MQVYHWADLHEEALTKTLQRLWHPSSSPGLVMGSKVFRHQPRPRSWLLPDDPGGEHVPRLACSTHLDLQVGFPVPADFPSHQSHGVGSTGGQQP